MSRRITVSASALLLLSSGLATPAASAIVPGSASFAPAPAPASWTDCDLEVLLGCPASPEITSVTAEVSQIHVSWAWPGETQMPSDITELVVRVSPGDLEVVVAQTESTVSIAELEPETEYSVTVLAVSGFQLGVPSNPATVATLAATLDEDSAEGNAYGSEGEALKPQASPGDVDGLIVTLKDDHSTESVAANAASDLPIAGVAAEQTQDLGAGNAKIELSQGVSESDAQAIIVDLESDPRVESVEVDRRVY
ncbi:MAG: fibronectin type III domain-containing protein, partial [Actinomycetales bacterium]|nr:fibronectin type III domain-containing protein [Actinomycetales bacterium]